MRKSMRAHADAPASIRYAGVTATLSAAYCCCARRAASPVRCIFRRHSAIYPLFAITLPPIHFFSISLSLAILLRSTLHTSFNRRLFFTPSPLPLRHYSPRMVLVRRATSRCGKVRPLHYLPPMSRFNVTRFFCAFIAHHCLAGVRVVVYVVAAQQY